MAFKIRQSRFTILSNAKLTLKRGQILAKFSSNLATLFLSRVWYGDLGVGTYSVHYSAKGKQPYGKLSFG